MPLPSMKTAQRCTARSKRSGVQCQNPAAYGCGMCRFHGARKPATIESGHHHPNYRHGERTKEAIAAQKLEFGELKVLKAQLKKTGVIK